MESGASPLCPGYRLDRYELLCPIASGGMASVWLAQLRGKRGFEKLFAIKTIKADLTDDATFQEMFLDEARIASGIQHPNVAQILDLGEQDEVLYIVMEWVDGDSLSRILKLGRKRGHAVPIGVALRIVADACEGLHAAHELRDDQGRDLGVVHRDVSPQNLLVSTAGSIKVIDFGIAKATNRHAGDTREGIVKGKVRYMAPEQVNGKSTDRRADVWAMGVCLYELVTGELPFDSKNDVDVVRRLMSDEAPPLPGGAVPAAVDQVLARSLVRMRDARFPTAASMHRALEEAIDDIGGAATNEDVAEYVRKAVPELEKQRRATVTKALAEAKARTKEPEVPRAGDSVNTLEEALAPTVLSGRTTEPHGAARRRPVPAAPDESKPTLRASELVREAPSRGGGLVWGALVLAAVGAGGWFVWPGSARVREVVGSFAAAPPRPDPVDAAPPAASVDSAPIVAPPPEPPVVVAEDGGFDAAFLTPPHVDAGPRRRHTWPIGAPLPGVAPSAFPLAPLPAPSAESPDDSNPYN